MSCATCGKGKVTYDCKGCEQKFCLNHLVDHQKVLEQQLDDIENQRNVLKQTINQYSEQHSAIKQIDLWEQESIEHIRQTAQQSRDKVKQYINQIDMDLNKLTDEMKDFRAENDFNEIHLNDLKSQLERLENQLIESNNVEFRQESTLIQKMNVNIPCDDLRIDTKWNPNGITIAGQNQFNNPWGIYMDNDNESIYIADSHNHRIIEWKKDAKIGQIVAGGNGPGREQNQLNEPVDVLIDHRNDRLIIADYGNRRVVQWPRRNGRYGQTIVSNVKCFGLAINNQNEIYVTDCEKHEVRRWKIGAHQGVLVAGGNGKGESIRHLNHPRYIFVDQNESVYISDMGNHRVVKWMKDAREGIVVAGDQGQDNRLEQLNHPNGIFVDQFESVYIADSLNNRIVRWLKNAKQGELIVGGNGYGNQSSQLSYPVNFVFNREHYLYVVDHRNHRIQKFSK